MLSFSNQSCHIIHMKAANVVQTHLVGVTRDLPYDKA